MAPTGQEASKSSTVGTGAFDPEGANLSQVPGPLLQIPISPGSRRRTALAETNPLLVNGDCHMLVPVCVDPDDHLNSSVDLATAFFSHGCLLKDGVQAV